MKEKGIDKRTREGCLICKLRHVKCDRTRPTCRNCLDSRRKCAGYGFYSKPDTASTSQSQQSISPSTSTTNGLSPREIIFSKTISAWPQWTPKEVRSFSYGLRKTIPNLTIYFDSDFWGKQIPRLAHNIPAIRHALNALASFHEKSISSDLGPISPGTQVIPMQSFSMDKFFLQQYNKAIEGLSRHFVEQGLPKSVCILVCCALFVCLEGLHGRHRAMVNHLRNGLKVFHEWVGKQDPDTQFAAGSIEASVYETFQRIDFHAAAFLDGHIPQLRQLTVIQQFPQTDMIRPIFTSVPQARSHIDTLYGRTFLFLRTFDSSKFQHLTTKQIPAEILEKHGLLTMVNKSCAAALERFSCQNEQVFTHRETRSMTMLKIRIKIISVFVRKWPYEHAPHEEVEPEFQTIIELARLMIREHLYGTPIPSDSENSGSSEEETSPPPDHVSSAKSTGSGGSNFDEPPIFTLEVGLLPILYYIGLSSSRASIRSEAVHLLRSANLREGLWSSARAANMVEQRLVENNWQKCSITGVEMSELTKKLWTELQIEEENGLWS